MNKFNSARSRRTTSTDARTQEASRYFATFRTEDKLIPFVEFTVVAPTPEQAKQIARRAAAPLGLSKGLLID